MQVQVLFRIQLSLYNLMLRFNSSGDLILQRVRAERR